MDRSTITALIFIVASAAIAYLGANSGDGMTTTLPGGKVTGVVAGVIILMGLFVGAYKKLRDMDCNRLNEEGFKNLLEIYFGAVSHGLLHVFNEALLLYESNPEQFRADVLFIQSKTVISQARNRLLPFNTHNISNIPQFLDGHLPQEIIEKRLKEGFDIINSIDGRDRKQRLIFKLIQRVQAELLHDLQSKNGV
ncbi:MAG: hypothetical protein PHD37_07520 [Gallionellaceae bacterium]|nr:hypothetical protein [Gallionellaceae bacterium]